MTQIWRETFSNIRYSGLIGLLSIIVVILTAMMLSGLLIIANYIHTELSVVKKSPLVVAFLKDGLSDSDRQQTRNSIEGLPQVRSTKYVSKAEALRKTREMFAGHAEVLEGLEDINPLPSSFEIELKPQFLDAAKELAEKLGGFQGVEDTQYAEKTSEFVKKIETPLIFIGSILGLTSVVIVCFSIMLTTYIRREEIRIMRLVGATGLFIRIPLLLQGVMQGFMGSVIGLAILYGLLNLMELRTGPISFLPLNQVVLVVVLGVSMGFIAGAIPLRRLIKI
ncbi:cell division protein FtsX [Candidatus Poribacteria bacterium]